ncbi:hypothetical protein M9435_000798 [Picochlorum sp. BPE23]|nr:hypothetical protein M9435_000798 [Picochlorum sp. BPE23]
MELCQVILVAALVLGFPAGTCCRPWNMKYDGSNDCETIEKVISGMTESGRISNTGVRGLLENVNKEGSAAEVGYDDDDDLVIEGPLFVEGDIGIDMNGVYLLVATVGACGLYIFYCAVMCWVYTRRATSSMIESARFRLCATRGDVPGMVLLYKNNKNVLEGSNCEGWTALHGAVVNGRCDSALWLLQHGADFNAVKSDGWGDTALHYACEQGNETMVKLLVEWGADVMVKNSHGDDAVTVAASAGHKDICEYLSSRRQRTREENIKRHKYEGKFIEKMPDGSWKVKTGDIKTADQNKIGEYLKRAFDGLGTEGTVIDPYAKIFRYFAVICQASGVIYLVWRALRSLRPGLGFIYSCVFWLCEFFPFVLSNAFFVALWNQIHRPDRYLSKMLNQEDFPVVEIMIVTYNEPLSVIEPTVIACINMDYPGDKLHVCILDDGGRDEVATLARKLSAQMEYMERKACLRYISRKKTKGVNHHAKAGNINSFLCKASKTDAEFVVVFDCDMIAHPGFLEKTLGHFYSKGSWKNGSRNKGEGWSMKQYCAFTQTPQDFWNVGSDDPLVHCARFFYGPTLRGRDGVGACPCCGTGVIFRRDILVSIGGQKTFSITEDYNTAMHLLASGFSSQYLNTRLSFGMAPEDISGVFRQRLRWAIGALQIFYTSNPLQVPGLTLAQRFLFFESCSHYFLSFSTLIMCIAPLVYVFSEYSPLVVDQLWELCLVFGFYYLMNRVTMWIAHLSLLKLNYFESEVNSSGVQLELWRGSQLWVWMAPNHIRAVVIATLNYMKGASIKFSVTKKDVTKSNFWSNLIVLMPYLLYYAAYLAAIIYFIVLVSVNKYTAWRVVIYITALAWATLIVLYLWPPVSLLLPRIETEKGWKISWRAFFDTNTFKIDRSGRLGRLSQVLMPELPVSPFANIVVDRDKNDDRSVATSNDSRKIEQSEVSDEMIGRWNVGRIALPHRTSEVLGSTLLFTNDVLPEPESLLSRDESLMDRRILSLHMSGKFGSLARNLSSQDYDRSPDLQATLSYGSNGKQMLRFADASSEHSMRIRELARLSEACTDVLNTADDSIDDFEKKNSIAISLDAILSGISGSLVPGTSMRVSGDASDLRRGSYIVVPVLPEDMYMCTIAAQPSFHEKILPARSFMFLIVNAAMISALIAGAVLDVTTDHDGPVL